MGRPRTDSVRQRGVVDGTELVAVLAGSRAAGIAGMVRRPEGRGGGYWGEELGLGSRGWGSKGVREGKQGTVRASPLIDQRERGARGEAQERAPRHGASVLPVAPGKEEGRGEADSGGPLSVI